ncbi:MAG: hypothetical protein ACREPQ_19255 [Rhodanobacter sp.]
MPDHIEQKALLRRNASVEDASKFDAYFCPDTATGRTDGIVPVDTGGSILGMADI